MRITQKYTNNPHSQQKTEFLGNFRFLTGFNKRFIVLLAGAVLIAIFAVAPRVFAVLGEGASQLKIFNRDSATIEASVNSWLASQNNIIIDQIKANNYGGDYAVIISYRTGGQGSVLTRVKVFNSNALTGSIEGNEKTVEAQAQEFISSFNSTQTIRSADILAGGGPWDIFIIYDEHNPIQIVTSGEPSASIIENIGSFIENLINPSVGETGAGSPIPEGLTQEQNSATTMDISTTTTIEIPVLPPEEQNATTATDISTTTTIEIPVLPLEEQNATTSLAAAALFGANLLFNNRIGELALLFLVLAMVYGIEKMFRKVGFF